MTIDQLKKAHRATPFRPFVIRLADGRGFPIPHPEFLLIPPVAERTFVVAESDGTFSIIDLLMVVSLDFNIAEQRKAG